MPQAKKHTAEQIIAITGDTDLSVELDAFDLIKVQNKFGNAAALGSASASAVPERSTLLLTMISIALLLGRRRKNSYVN